jgi:asparagine synthase (glutamine-hydrolysing)
MCGIAGEVRFGNPPDAAAVARATRAIAHRGPDAESFFTEGPAALGHRRLAILDIAGGVQPMTQDGVTLIFNGQVFEHDALREELRKKGHTFQTRSDTEVVLRAYLEWGEHFAAHLDGMLACALWDSRSQRLVFSRDRMGKKPLHYALSEGRIVFGSELKALIAHGALTRELDPEALVQYLSSEAIAAPRTLFKDVKKLPPGCTAVFDQKGLRVFQYWELPAPDYTSLAYQRSRPSTLGLDASDAHLPSGDVHEAAQELLKLLDGAVARRLVADVPVGVFLSGGVDSTTIAALSARHKQPLDTFSIGF